jgi:protein-disulfide isomerase
MMRTVFLVLALGLAAVLPAAVAGAAEFGAGERQQIEGIVRDYLKGHPEVIIEALENFKDQRQAEAEKAAQAAIIANRDALQKNPASPVAGNAKGDVTIVEFFDYRCGYCKKMLPTMQELLKSDGNLRWVFKEFPILGPDSQRAAQAAQAVWAIAPQKYLAFHIAMMENRGGFDDAAIQKIAAGVGIDGAQLTKAMADPAIKERLASNLELAQQLNINGTPAFVVGDKLVPGAADAATLKQLIADARGSR